MTIWCLSLCVCVSAVESRRRSRMPQRWVYRLLYATKYECWGLNLGPPEDQKVLLTAKQALHPSMSHYGMSTWSLICTIESCPLQNEAPLTKVQSSPGLWVQ